MIDESIFINRRPWQRAAICLAGWMAVLPAIILWQSPTGAARLAAAVTLPAGVDEQAVQGAAETTARGLRERQGLLVQNAAFHLRDAADPGRLTGDLVWDERAPNDRMWYHRSCPAWAYPETAGLRIAYQPPACPR